MPPNLECQTQTLQRTRHGKLLVAKRLEQMITAKERRSSIFIRHSYSLDTSRPNIFALSQSFTTKKRFLAVAMVSKVFPF